MIDAAISAGVVIAVVSETDRADVVLAPRRQRQLSTTGSEVVLFPLHWVNFGYSASSGRYMERAPWEVVERLNTLLGQMDQCQMQSFDGSRLVIIGSFDIGYYRDFEAEFGEVSYMQCATSFFADTFRLATVQERAKLELPNHTDDDDSFFCFESDNCNFFIAAKSLTLREGHRRHEKHYK